MDNQPVVKSYSPFLPVVLIALGVVILLSWNLMLAIKQHSNGLRINGQQELQLAQATNAAEKLQAMMTDLIDLAKTDTDAETIVKRYKIAYNKNK